MKSPELRIKLSRLIILPAIAVILLSDYACKNDIQLVNALNNKIDVPDQTGYNVTIEYSDSGIIKGRIITPELYKFDDVDVPYVEFPKGIKVLFFDRNENVESYIKAKYALYYEKKELWVARDSVYAVNLVNGEKLETEELYWDQKSEKVYSDKFTKVTNADGVFYGENGFEAKQDMSKWRLIGSTGTVNVRNE